MVWHEQTAEGEVTHHSEPNSGMLRRAGVKVMSWLPIDWLL
jgi:putative cardiolipin synthase